ncbi:MAG: hypothetical protein IJS50_03685, partial [Desulfovibrio sp.]|nr:hypothetical protein [Desulfovibrio sp.]
MFLTTPKQVLKASTKILIPLLLFLACPLFLKAAGAEEVIKSKNLSLTPKEAEEILQDTFTIAGYVGLNGEKDYLTLEENIIRAALFGAFDAKNTYSFELNESQEENKTPPSKVLFKIGQEEVLENE